VAFYFNQCHSSEPLTQFLQERIDYSKVYHLLGAGVEVASPPFPDNVEDNQAVNKDQQVDLIAVPLAHIPQQL
jgi:hypothetical protein